jgi:hypothetical protein
MHIITDMYIYTYIFIHIYIYEYVNDGSFSMSNLSHRGFIHIQKIQRGQFVFRIFLILRLLRFSHRPVSQGLHPALY